MCLHTATIRSDPESLSWLTVHGVRENRVGLLLLGHRHWRWTALNSLIDGLWFAAGETALNSLIDGLWFAAAETALNSLAQFIWVD